MEKLIACLPKNARERVQVELSQFSGHDLLDIRVYADNGAEWVPTKKGVTVRLGLLPALRDALLEAERQARLAGLLETVEEGADG